MEYNNSADMADSPDESDRDIVSYTGEMMEHSDAILYDETGLNTEVSEHSSDIASDMSKTAETSYSLMEPQDKTIIASDDQAMETFQCITCGKVLETKDALEEHMSKSHTTGKLYLGNQGNEKVLRASTLASHISSRSTPPDPMSLEVIEGQTKEKQHKCPHCERMFLLFVSLKHHMLSHNKKNVTGKKYTCIPCKRDFIGNMAYQNHKQKHICSHCGNVFSSLSARRRHENRAHSGVEVTEPMMLSQDSEEDEPSVENAEDEYAADKEYTCVPCNIVFSGENAYKLHRQKHVCHHCEKVFNSISNRRRHENNVHSGTASLLTSQLDVKEEQPSEDNIHKCPHCPKRFTFPNSLRHHMHVHTKKRAVDKKYKCVPCKIGFSNKALFLQHRKMHICRHCRKVFTLISRCQHHEVHLHANVTLTGQHSCPHCNKLFNTRQGVHKHIRNLHPSLAKVVVRPEQTHACPYCPKKYAWLGDCQKHIRQQHPSYMHSVVSGKRRVYKYGKFLKTNNGKAMFQKSSRSSHSYSDLSADGVSSENVSAAGDFIDPMSQETEMAHSGSVKSEKGDGFIPTSTSVDQPLRNHCPYCPKRYCWATDLRKHLRKKHPSLATPMRPRRRKSDIAEGLPSDKAKRSPITQKSPKISRSHSDLSASDGASNVSSENISSAGDVTGSTYHGTGNHLAGSLSSRFAAEDRTTTSPGESHVNQIYATPGSGVVVEMTQEIVTHVIIRCKNGSVHKEVYRRVI